MTIHDVDWDAPLPPEQRREQELRRLRALPYRIFYAKLEIDAAKATIADREQQLRELRQEQRRLESVHGKQPKETWMAGDVIEAVEKIKEPKAARWLLGRMMDEKSVAERRERAKQRRKARRTGAT